MVAADPSKSKEISAKWISKIVPEVKLVAEVLHHGRKRIEIVANVCDNLPWKRSTWTRIRISWKIIWVHTNANSAWHCTTMRAATWRIHKAKSIKRISPDELPKKRRNRHRCWHRRNHASNQRNSWKLDDQVIVWRNNDARRPVNRVSSFRSIIQKYLTT